MHVAIVNYAHAADLTEPEDLLERYFSLTNWADGLVEAGARVTVLQAFGHDATRVHNDVVYRFIDDGLPPLPHQWQVPRRLHRAVRQLAPDAVHVNGLVFPVALWVLRRQLPPSVPLLAQHHAERPWTGRRGLVQRVGLRAADGFMFAARALAEPWIERGSIRSWQPVYEIMEGSTTFQVWPRAVARAQTGLAGDPVFFWAGNLDANKDPLTVLHGFELALPALPQARLYMAYRDAALLPQVQARIDQSSALTAAVTLLGSFPHAGMERYFNSADYFVQGSHREGSGYALNDALACGVVPVVTDIPTFRVMTHQGTIGALWPVDDAAALAAAIHTVVARPWAEQSAAARQFFDARLSIAGIGRQALAAYVELAQRRNPVR
jgi:glycosyltransferase involved in cell wall biosynthesis